MSELSAHVVVAPDKFKGSLTAAAAADAIARGIRAAIPGIETRIVPLADGGDGTVDALLGDERWQAMRCDVRGALGAPRRATFAFDGATAVVEMATASGLAALAPHERDAKRAGTFGSGELIRAALDCGATRVILAVGGTASVDAGTGALTALGVRWLDAEGALLDPGGAALSRLARIDLDGLDPRLRSVRIEVAADVVNPLLGENGAAAVFGPQKGASPEDVVVLEAALAHFAGVVEARYDAPGLRDAPRSGAGGGVPFSFRALLGSSVGSGFSLVADAAGLDKALDGARAAITGEGWIDMQTLGGKVVSGVSSRARAAGVAAFAFGGVVDGDAAEALKSAGCTAIAISPGVPVEIAMRDAATLLFAAAKRAAEEGRF